MKENDERDPHDPPPPPGARRGDEPGRPDRTSAAAAEPDGTRPDEDPFEALLEEGWSRLDRGDMAGAARAADEAERLTEGHDQPEILTLRGAIASSDGDVEEAMSRFRRAMDLDPGYVDPYLHAADLQLYGLEQPEEAVRLCDAALDVAEEEEDYLDALLLKAEAQLEAGDEKAARATLSEVPPAHLPDPQLHLRVGHLLLDLGDLDDAERHFRQALSDDPDLTDALHAVALVHEERGQIQEMVRSYLKVREADLQEPPAPWGVSRERFEALAEEALGELPERIRALLANVPVLVSDYPSLEVVAEGTDPRSMGFFSGIPYPDKGTIGGAPPHLDCVFLYQRNIERICRTSQEVEEEIRKTLIHEAGHFFGLTDEELEAMGLG